MNALAIALLQLAGAGMDQAANLAAGEAACRRAASLGADVALFPEMWNIAYTPYPAHDAEAAATWRAAAIDADGPFVRRFGRLARELNLAIAVTFLERWPGGPRNSLTLFDRHGGVALSYAKVHTCAFDLEAVLTPGDAFPVCDLDTAKGPVRTGAMICFDREFPESARVLMLEGAELILTPNACYLDDNRVGQFRARAFENMTAVAMANYAAPRENGRSCAFDGMAYTWPGGRSRDMRLVEAGDAEGIYLAHLDLAELRAYRAREPWGERYRRPSAYGPLHR